MAIRRDLPRGDSAPATQSTEHHAEPTAVERSWPDVPRTFRGYRWRAPAPWQADFRSAAARHSAMIWWWSGSSASRSTPASPPPTGHSHYINGTAGLAHLHRLRALVDAVVVGSRHRGGRRSATDGAPGRRSKPGAGGDRPQRPPAGHGAGCWPTTASAPPRHDRRRRQTAAASRRRARAPADRRAARSRRPPSWRRSPNAASAAS